MIVRYGVWLVILTIAIISLSTQPAYSQYAKDTNYLYFKGTTALSTYFGDLYSSNSDLSLFGFGYRGGMGYQFTPNFAAGINYRVGDYPRTERPEFTGYTRSHTANLYMAYTFIPRRLISPYIFAGAGMTFYGTYDDHASFNPAFGPMAGFGFDLRLTDQLSAFFESKVDFILDDEAMDMRRGDAGFDALGFMGIGIRVNLRSSFRPITRMRIAGPDTIYVAESVSFRAEFAGNPSEPITVRWFFGDGNSAEGRAVSNVFTKTGTYTVTMRAADRRSERETRREVRVVEPPVKAVINKLSTEESLHFTNEPVRFVTEVEGTGPIAYQWDFGDGTTSTDASPAHTYRDEGTYEVSLRVDNRRQAGDKGVHERSITIDVYDPEPVQEPEPEPEPELTELNTIYFAMGSVQLSSEAQQLLLENVELLKDHPDYCVQIDVFTDSVGNPQTNLRLSEQRARAVERFYIQQGIEAARVNRTGLGEINEPCPPDDPGPGCREHRRAESVPQRCD